MSTEVHVRTAFEISGEVVMNTYVSDADKELWFVILFPS